MDRRSFLKTMRNLVALAAVPTVMMGSKTQEQAAAERAAFPIRTTSGWTLHGNGDLEFHSDPNTGFYRVDADELGFFTYHKEDFRNWHKV